MRVIKTRGDARPAIVGLLVAISAFTASCSSSSPGESPRPFVLVVASAPGSLDPQASALGVVRQLSYFLYDTLVTDVRGQVRPDLASSWHETTGAITLVVRRDARCTDGTTLTAADVAANVRWVADRAHGSPLRDRAVPGDSTTSVDTARNAVTIRYRPSAFVLEGLADLPIVCRSALHDRRRLVSGADGTGPYRLARAIPGDRYELTRIPRDTRHPSSLPQSAVVRVVADESTTANLLLDGEADAGTVNGADSARLKSDGLTVQSDPLTYGEILFNQSDPLLRNAKVRRALAGALDLPRLRAVATEGRGTVPPSLTSSSPCGASGITAVLPRASTDEQHAAARVLAGHILTVLYQSTHGAAGSAAAELLVREWQGIGVRAQARALSDAALFSTVFDGSDWDVLMAPVDGATPAATRGTFSGPSPAGGGSNFAHIDNTAYNSTAADAAARPGDTGCPLWREAERALVADADVVPFAQLDRQIWTSHRATVSTWRGYVLPDSVRLSGR